MRHGRAQRVTATPAARHHTSTTQHRARDTHTHTHTHAHTVCAPGAFGAVGLDHVGGAESIMAVAELGVVAGAVGGPGRCCRRGRRSARGGGSRRRVGRRQRLHTTAAQRPVTDAPGAPRGPPYPPPPTHTHTYIHTHSLKPPPLRPRSSAAHHLHSVCAGLTWLVAGSQQTASTAVALHCAAHATQHTPA
jgi:hypothetical protein